MSIQNATLIKKGLAFGGTIPDYSSAIGYKESIGSTCRNPSGYTVGSFFVGSNDGYFYKVTSAIAYGDTLIVGVSGNCEQTTVAYELANNSGGDTATVRYNENTDRFEVLLNGSWVQSIKAYADNLILFDGTSFYAPYENGVYKPASNWSLQGGFTINLPNFVAPYYAVGNACYSFAFANAIDVTEYSSLIVETSSGTLTVDISNVSQSAYIILYVTYDSTYDTSVAGCKLEAVLATAKNNWSSYRITSNKKGNMTNSYITNIRLVK